MLYYKRRQGEGTRRIHRAVHCPSRRWFSFPIGPSQRACLLISSPFCGIGLVVLLIIVRVCMVISFLTTGKRPVTAWREHTHADKAVGRLTARTDGQLILSIGITEVRRSLKPKALGQHHHRQPCKDY